MHKTPRSVPTYTPGKKGADGTVADEARSATLKRRGAWKLTSDKVQSIAPLVAEAASDNGIPQDLIYGVIWVESRFNPEAVSPVGARGLMQLMPKTADYLADCIDWSASPDAFDPEFNIAAGSYYIKRLIDQFDGDEELALAAYNAGPTKIRRWMKGDGLPPVSIEYYTMVQTARGFFGSGSSSATSGGKPLPNNDDLDRLGLAILIAGLSDDRFGLEREDDANPFD
jgi:soluble lytic murein transglycosylase-like protein